MRGKLQGSVAHACCCCSVEVMTKTVVTLGNVTTNDFVIVEQMRAKLFMFNKNRSINRYRSKVSLKYLVGRTLGMSELCA
jgi:hypothetical protein